MSPASNPEERFFANKSAALTMALAGAAALYALQYLPYGYYSVIRIVVCLGAGYGAWWLAKASRPIQALLAAGAAILFNPIFPMRMRRTDWHTFDLWTGVILLALAVYAYRLSAWNRAQRPPSPPNAGGL